ncbi:hypothetical protein QJS10_CPA16g01563 [Acorus calamus]|uniref:Uncharacterized protein n=1 Tax=Acorus calamus TaxID=4465 RepID=A0AAV9D4H6_ACOCL|nr:hypothetical protein QJS10_CPA16g01563 [Acorus calamus]
MAPPADLEKIGREGFDLLEKYLLRKGREKQAPPKRESAAVQTIDAITASKKYKGLVFVEYGRRSPRPAA